MRNILQLFGRSPFAALQSHMAKVRETLDQVRPFLEAFLAGETEAAREIRKSILKLEHDADLVKNDVRDHLPKSYFMPVDRRELLSLLHQQDQLADVCEDIVIVASLKDSMHLPADLRGEILDTFDLARASCDTAMKIIGELDELLEASFGGPEADKVIELINQASREEHEVDKRIYAVARLLFKRESEIGAVDLALWQKLLQLIGKLANASESIGDQVRLMLSR